MQNINISVEKPMLQENDISKKKSKTILASKKSANRRKRNMMLNVLSIICFFLLWEGILRINSIYGFFNATFMPMPSKILQVGYEQILDGTLLIHLLVSVKRILIGVSVGVMIAFLVAIVFVKVSSVEAVILPVINFVGAVPIIALLPAVIIWFGIGDSSKLFIVIYGTFNAVLGYALNGMKNTDPILIRSAMSLGASKFQQFWNVIIPFALPNIFAGIKASLATSFSAMLVAEMMGSTEGLGYMIINAKAWFKMDDMFLAIIMIGLLYTLFHAVVSFIEKRLFSWKVIADKAIED